jgi:hypothetical protein
MMALPHMRASFPYITVLLSWLLLAGCGEKSRLKKTDWTTDLGLSAKKPYSLYLAYKSIPLLFPEAKVEKLKGDYRLTNLGYTFRKNKGKSMLVMIGLDTRFAAGELDSLLAFVEDGHQIMLSGNHLDEDLLSRLQLKQSFPSFTSGKKQQQVFLRNKTGAFRPFPYRYRDHGISGYFASKDTVNAPFFTLGLNENNNPDYIIFSIGKGKLFLHAAPIAFSNYFLLQQHNKDYLSTLFRYMPGELSNVYLCTYNYRDVTESDWSVIWRNKATRTAILLALMLLVIFVLFEMKRRQQVIPIIAPVENSSVAFVETIGRLYYNKKNHTNLAEKMVQHFLDFVRNNYYLNTNLLDGEFVRHLAAKSGNDIAKTDALVHTIKEVQSGVKADEAFLYSLYNQIQQFYHGK